MKRPDGPPAGKFRLVKNLRMTEQDARQLEALAEAWGCSESAVIRRLLREAAPPAPSEEAAP